MGKRKFKGHSVAGASRPSAICRQVKLGTVRNDCDRWLTAAQRKRAAGRHYCCEGSHSADNGMPKATSALHFAEQPSRPISLFSGHPCRGVGLGAMTAFE